MPSTVDRILSVFGQHNVQYLLMGGQACVIYGGAEFSRDTGLALLADAANMEHVTAALLELKASIVAVPPYNPDYLKKGHAIHFVCAAAGNTRLDLMARRRNVPDFRECWHRRSTLTLPCAGDVNVMGLEDLVACKKTQREKDWPMITRLVDVNYVSAVEGDLEITPAQSQFWLRELRTPDLLLDCVRRVPEMAEQVAYTRPATAAAADAAFNAAAPHRIQELLDAEQRRERAADVIYWAPLRAELESLRHAAARGELAMGWPP